MGRKRFDAMNCGIAQALEAMENMDPRPPRLEDLRRALETAISEAGAPEGEG